ncbi:MAG: VOC family protein [Deltaproteobacteria bacterium]|nr:VOC family protein [Deltaproteobacteria bacterium]
MAKKTKAKKAKRVVAKKKAAPKRVLPVPNGYHTVTPHLIVGNCAEALAWYGKAFGAKELSRMAGPDGKVMHSEIRIGDSIVMLSDEQPPLSAVVGVRKAPTNLGGNTGGLMLYVKDVDAWFTKAVGAGGKVSMPVTDMFWGDRYGQLVDPFGHVWAIATRKANLTQKQMMKAAQESMSQAPAQQQAA